MSINYQTLSFDYKPCREQAEQGDAEQVAYPVIVVGAGPVGLATAIDIAQQGVPVVLVDDDCSLSTGSRAICFSKRSLDIFDRLGCGQRMVDKGISWNVGKVFLKDELVYTFNLQPEAGHNRPAFINLQQYYVEGFLLERAQEMPNLEIRWKSKVVGVQQNGTAGSAQASVTLTVDTPNGQYPLHGRYVVAADGSRSPMRNLMGLDSHGVTFKDRFLIADVKMEAEFPTERWFWFDPPFHPNQSVLLHRQPDNVWRIDFQLGWDADPVLEKTPERVIPRVRALLGADAKFELEWVSVYTFSCLRMDRFRHGNVLFAGDSAHGVSPFGARGANSGVQDAENLAWKLAMVLEGKASDALLDTYASEREFAADENIRNSTRSTDFITPKSPVSRVFRDAVLKLARHHPFARQLTNSGRLSVPAVLRDSPLNTADSDSFEGLMVPGASCVDAPVHVAGESAWLLQQLGQQFTGVLFCGSEGIDQMTQAALDALQSGPIPLKLVVVVTSNNVQVAVASGAKVVHDVDGLTAARYDGKPGTFYLIRPDQHVCARRRQLDASFVEDALKRALCVEGTA
ncbi:3-(3-hydroxy-phenyl)propionate/3-hydroxycinnamic acid hydroxylase [Paraburkholderia aspalathi]|uniref:3-(3-hydroxy-phenyl)propionate/3-hydroxycinnamic acid hydroxylase n=1 Tax=Paraburkholderia aspalathi TaxID=1324617 RepID=A0ABM8SXL5_9BURK|nr:FAD-dependent oxidoreductase [Paraburkholderia aspalathi]MBK3823027.1 FAD-dependent oxidoreductase [Paraburkholderia aspalathi]MBK3834836.1 FAD-dependent oxidoreductase [Paraburkholderia aspalathi]MBK3864591.1 FAD-dependent oxidoreductase [Paraburkholderia aspalathi]CAE6839719.1 3-(3-hydroxy-phenyl)propionate/3-hydroxycinnamic acid hydroxylase [Paraburkholderia aspalathi]